MLWASIKTATAKATRNRNCPTWNQGDFSLSRSDGFKLVVIGVNSLLGKFVVSHPCGKSVKFHNMVYRMSPDILYTFVG